MFARLTPQENDYAWQQLSGQRCASRLKLSIFLSLGHRLNKVLRSRGF